VLIHHHMTAGVYNECFRCQQGFNFIEQQQSLFATRNQTRRGRVQDQCSVFDFGNQCRDRCAARGVLGPCQRCARGLGLEASDGDPPRSRMTLTQACSVQRPAFNSVHNLFSRRMIAAGKGNDSVSDVILSAFG